MPLSSGFVLEDDQGAGSRMPAISFVTNLAHIVSQTTFAKSGTKILSIARLAIRMRKYPLGYTKNRGLYL